MTATWTQPRTWSVGELTTAALMNQHLRDELDWLKTPTESGKLTFAADFTTTSTSYVDLTGLTTGSITWFGGGLDVDLRLTASMSAGSLTATFQLLVDGVFECVLGSQTFAATATNLNCSYTHHIAALSAGSHTIKVQVKTSGGTLTIKGTTGAAGDPLFYVREAGA